MSTFTSSNRSNSVDAPSILADDDQQEETSDHNVMFWVEKSLVDDFYFYDKALGSLLGFSKQDIDLVLMEQAKELGPHKPSQEMPRFYELMEHFLSGCGWTMYFKMSDLLDSCAGARLRVSQAISDRISTHAGQIFGSPTCDLPTHDELTHGKRKYSVYQFPIKQSDYQNKDWQFALGTFSAMWEPLRPELAGVCGGPLCVTKVGDQWIDSGTMALTRNIAPTDRFQPVNLKVTRAKVWGAKVWRWHSKTDRTSEQVHKAGFRLVQSGLLRNFWVIAEPCIVDIATGRPVAK